jgi:glycosyltransferase involved in cell wall biosynthesis
MTRRPRLLVVSPRPPRRDGQGDQRRAAEIVAALDGEWEIDVLSWLPDPDEGAPLRPFRGVRHAAQTAAKSVRAPAHVAYVQAAAAFSLRAALERGQDLTLFVTDRSVPPGFDRPFVIDFIDDMGGAALRRGASGGNPVVAGLWRLEGRRLRAWDRRLAARARVAFEVSQPDAAAIAAGVRAIPLAMAAEPEPGTGDKVAFTGNLFYGPNHEAALWICNALVPRLERLGIGRDRLVVAGRRPHPELQAATARAGVELRRDVDDLAAVVRDASVVIAPVSFGSGVQCKVLDAVGAGRACVLTAFANRALGLVDGESALVRERNGEHDGDGFAEAVAALLADSSLRQRLAEGARRQLRAHRPAAVATAWRDAFATLSTAHPADARPVGESEAV